jgi:hypothetical protein
MVPGDTDKIFVTIAPWLLIIIESVLVMAAVALAFVSARRGKTTAVFLSNNSWFARLARRKTLAIMAVGASTLVLRVAIIPIWCVPQPMWHDEFSFLLAADTFAHGRVTNPTHPMWIHFESFHIIEQPTYMSMYPPGQGVILAAGELLGHPWIGQLVVTSLMCAALCWMLQAWLPASWALLGAALAMLEIGTLGYWMNSYFGGSLGALGGVLVLGAWPRIQRHARLRDALLMGVGLAIMANTRPFEGFMFSLPFAAAMLIWLVKPKRVSASMAWLRVAFPVAVVLAVTGLGMTYYFWRVTGNQFEMPYQVNRAQYAVAPYFAWQKPGPEPVYRHAEMRAFYINWELKDYLRGRSFGGFLQRLGFKARMLWSFYSGPVFSLPLLVFPLLLRDRRMRFPLILAATVLITILLETWTLAHYLAPALGLFYLLLVQCIRHLRLFRWRGEPVGFALARAIPVVCVAMIVLRLSAVALNTQIEPLWQRGNLKRNEVNRRLEGTPGKQLVIVHYGPKHTPHIDWIANRADIDASKVVWARDMGERQNEELIRYFSDRRVWLVNADDPAPQPQPYGAANASNPSNR